MPVLVTNCIPVNQAHAIDFEDRFVHRINHVDEAPGFIRNEVLRPDPRQFDHASGTWKEEAGEGGAVYRIATLWETMEHFIDWTKSPSFALAHAQKTPRDMFTHAPALDVHEVYLTTEDEEGQGERPPQRGVLVTNCIPVNQAHAIDFEDRFAKRIHHVDEAPGFIRNEVLRPSPRQFDHASGTWKESGGGGVYRIATLWETMEHFIDWTESPSFALAHAQKTPADMFSGPAVLEIHDVFLASAGGTTVQSGHYDGPVAQAPRGELADVDEAEVKDQARKARVQARMAKLQQEKQEQEAEPAGRKFQPFGAPKKKGDAVRVFTEEELAGHTTVESGLLLAARGQVFDVSAGKDFYGPGGYEKRER